nr:unnamed protein product [Callosobruchus analis]
MDDLGFLRRFRITKATAVAVLELIEDQLEFVYFRNNSVSPINQLLTALLFYATNGHQINIGDHMGMNQSTVSRIVGKVSRAIAGLRNRFIKMPSTPEDILCCQNNFYRLARFPRVIGCIDGTHVKIYSPGDGGYPLTQYLLTPLANPDTQPHSLYNESLHCKTETNLAIIVATAVLHNIALTMHDEIPPSPEGINDEELNYLIDQGQIPQINLMHGNDSLRSTIVNNYFANL